MLRRVALCALLMLAMLAMLAMPAAAVADGGYLHLREADALAKRVAAKTNGVVVLSPCERTSARSASCAMRQIYRQDGVVCRFVVRVAKRYAGGRYAWRAGAGRGDCEYVG